MDTAGNMHWSCYNPSYLPDISREGFTSVHEKPGAVETEKHFASIQRLPSHLLSVFSFHCK